MSFGSCPVDAAARATAKANGINFSIFILNLIFWLMVVPTAASGRARTTITPENRVEARSKQGAKKKHTHEISWHFKKDSGLRFQAPFCDFNYLL